MDIVSLENMIPSFENSPAGAQKRMEFIDAHKTEIMETLSNFCFPKSFFNKERELFSDFYSSLKRIGLFKLASHWETLGDKDKEKAAQIVVDTFWKAYKLPVAAKPEVAVVSAVEYQRWLKETHKLDTRPPVMSVNHVDNKLRIVKERSAGLSNVGFLSSVFHECIHLHQRYSDFSEISPAVDTALKKLQPLHSDETYFYLPTERHAFSMQYQFCLGLENDGQFKIVGKEDKSNWGLVQAIFRHSFSPSIENDPKESLRKLQEEVRKFQEQQKRQQVYSAMRNTGSCR